MRRNSSVFVLVLALAACGLAAMAGCSDDNKDETPSASSDGGSTTDGPTSNPGTDGGGPGPGSDGGKSDAAHPDAGLLFTDYVKDLVQNHTADNTTPDDVQSHTFVTPDPEDPSAFPASFF